MAGKRAGEVRTSVQATGELRGVKPSLKKELGAPLTRTPARLGGTPWPVAALRKEPRTVKLCGVYSTRCMGRIKPLGKLRRCRKGQIDTDAETNRPDSRKASRDACGKAAGRGDRL